LGIEPPVLLGFHDSGRKERQRHDDPRASPTGSTPTCSAPLPG
jgi:hypothetical protein